MKLKNAIQQFMREGMDANLFSASEVARFQQEFWGSSRPGGEGLGYLGFLKAHRIQNPKLEHLDEKWIQAYQQFVMDHYGLIRLRHSMQSLQRIWEWCEANSFIPPQVVPPLWIIPRPPRSTLHWKLKRIASRSAKQLG